MHAPELLAPAGGPEALPAAVAGGADAVYLGLGRFSARARAENFTTKHLGGHVDYLHEHGLRCYVALNTLIHDDELGAALESARAAITAGADALIVQDLGLLRLLRQHLPQAALHASTQMTVHDPTQLPVLADLGIRRVILARELDLEAIAACTRVAARHGIAVEVFVHGALCYAYSGQCLISALDADRSANRGVCAQHCRFAYRVDGGAPSHVLSMRDLCLIEHIPALLRAGVSAFKLEGRLKGADYVYTVARAYRAAIDAARDQRPFPAAEHRRELSEVFARRLSDAPLHGLRGPELRQADPADALPERADAHLLHCQRTRALIASARPLRAGQGFRYLGADGAIAGFLVTAARQVYTDRWDCRIRAPGPPPPNQTPLYRNADQGHGRAAAAAMATVPLPPPGPRREPLTLRLVAQVGRPLQLAATCADGRTAAVDGPEVDRATGRTAEPARLRAAVAALGGTAFRATEVHCDCDVAAFLPLSLLKRLRRELVAQLAALPLPAAGMPWRCEAGHGRKRATRVIANLADLALIPAAREAGATVWLDGLDLWAATPPTLDAAAEVWIRHPPVAPVSPHLAALGCGVVAGHLGVLAAARAAGLPTVADSPLNILNHQALHAAGALGAIGAVLSAECTPDRIATLASRCPAGLQLIVPVYGRRTVMYARADHGLSPGAICRLTGVERHGAWLLRREPGDHVTLREAGLHDARAHITALTGVVDAVLLDLSHLTASDAVAAEVASGVAALQTME
ncbi:MAG: peptidase U32 family protein [Planctomycetota bacterium]